MTDAVRSVGIALWGQGAIQAAVISARVRALKLIVSALIADLGTLISDVCYWYEGYGCQLHRDAAAAAYYGKTGLNCKV